MMVLERRKFSRDYSDIADAPMTNFGIQYVVHSEKNNVVLNEARHQLE